MHHLAMVFRPLTEKVKWPNKSSCYHAGMLTCYRGSWRLMNMQQPTSLPKTCS